jgi:hypothetical protein
MHLSTEPGRATVGAVPKNHKGPKNHKREVTLALFKTRSPQPRSDNSEVLDLLDR